MQKLLAFVFSKNISMYAIFNDQSFNRPLTNDIVNFEQLGHVLQLSVVIYWVFFFFFFFFFFVYSFTKSFLPLQRWSSDHYRTKEAQTTIS